MNVKQTTKFFLILLVFIPCIVHGRDFVVVLDPGHGGKDPGAVGALTKEKDINLQVALKLGNLIEQKHPDVRVLYTRRRDYFVELDQRADIANKANADLFISIHTNAILDKNHTGAETFTLGLARTKENLEVAKRENSAILLEADYKQKYEGFDPNSTESYIMFEFMQNKYMEQSIGFASYIQKELKSLSQRKDRGVKQAGFLVLRKTSMPSVLVELGFISNEEEEEYMGSDKGQRVLSESIYRAFRAYKNDHDRKSGYVSTAPETPVQTEVKPAPSEPKKVEPISPESEKTSGTVYKIQILTSTTKLPANSPKLKGYKNVAYYEEKGVYKYTYGAYENMATATVNRNEIAKDFHDAFVVVFKEGVRIK